MVTPAAHYEQLLARHYTWMLGGDLEALAARERDALAALGVRRGDVAIDLGCGPGPQTLALADMGFTRVIGVDSSRALLDELTAHAGSRPAVETVQGDVVDALPDVSADAVVCMRDTIVHLQSATAVRTLFERVAAALAPGGTFVLTYRDLTAPIGGLDRFIPVRADAEKVMLCVLDEADADTLSVTDLVHVRDGDGWQLHKSEYAKLRLAPDWVRDELVAVGLDIARHELGEQGMWATVATKAG